MAQPFPEELPKPLRLASIAATRFGYGARPGELESIAGDPLGWLLAQLEDTGIPSPHLADQPDGAAVVSGFIEARAAGRDAIRTYRRASRKQSRAEALAHTAEALSTPAPFRERLVRFWCNHFTVSALSPKVYPLVHAFERDAIRPFVTGSFAAMLTGVMKHPAMLLFFDNQKSIGPYSVAGLNGAGGLNENLAREILELHTLGDSAAYTQGDVHELSKILTGWSIAGGGEDGSGGFKFRENWHQPNKKYLLGKTYPEAGVLEGEAALDALSRQESTAHHLARKMARYFVADEPSSSLISDMVAGYATQGNSLKGMAEGMLRSSDAWEPVQRKVKTPEDLVFSTARALYLGADKAGIVLRSLVVLGQVPKHAPSPAGWSDLTAAWLSPQQLMERIEWGAAAARRGARGLGDLPIADLAFAVLGSQLTASTYRRLSVTRDTGQALALLFAAPEFQRR